MVAAGLSRPYSASVAASGATIDFICSVFRRLTRPSTAPKSARASTGSVIRHSPSALGELQRAVRRRDVERVDLVAIELRTVLSRRSNVVLLNVESRNDGNQEHALLIGKLRVEVGRRSASSGRSAACAPGRRLERDLDARLGQAVFA